MDTMKFFEERNRMCSTYEGCEGCPLLTTACEDIINITPQISVVEKWAKDHPRKTRQDVFLEQWPSAKVDENIGVLNICPADLDERYRDARGRCNIRSTQTGTCDHCRREFWMQEVK